MTRRATRIGCIAVLLWALLALFTAGAGAIPPFQLTAICFTIGGAVGLIYTAVMGRLSLLMVAPLSAWLLGVGGLFGYHFFYFVALQNAPQAEAGLIAYLWPLLIVLLAGLSTETPLRLGVVVGAIMGFAGAGVLILSGGGLEFDPAHAPGYAAALLCALIWSSYSVASRRFADVPTEAVAGFCLVAAILAWLCHWALEPTAAAPAGIFAWISVIALGLGPVGAAFYVWDYGVKHGDLQLLGVASYAAPLLSTLVLVAAGYAAATQELALAAALIVGGAALAGYSAARGGTPQ